MGQRPLADRRVLRHDKLCLAKRLNIAFFRSYGLPTFADLAQVVWSRKNAAQPAGVKVRLARLMVFPDLPKASTVRFVAFW
jgi:hypothetical protein